MSKWKRHPARPKNSVTKNPRGFRMHLQLAEAEALNSMIGEWLFSHPPMQNITDSHRRILLCNITEFFSRFVKLNVTSRTDVNIQISHAQFFALHHVFKFELAAGDKWEDIVLKTIFISLDKLTA